MKRRILFYLTYALVVSSLGFLAERLAASDKLDLFMIFFISFMPQYILSRFFLRKSIMITIIQSILFWIIATAFGLMVMAFYMRDNKSGPVELYAMLTFFLAMFLCYEISSRIGNAYKSN